MILIVGIGFWTGFYFFRPGLFSFKGSLFQKLLIWDGGWYLKIAKKGYYLSQSDSNAVFAFFPLYPLIDRAIHLIGVPFPLEVISNNPSAHWIMKKGYPNSFLYVIPSISFGIASIWAFFALAKETLSIRSAKNATAAYALYPGAQFFFAGYPTSIGNLLAILSLLYLVRNKPIVATLYAGIASAATPLGSLLVIPILIKCSRDSYDSLKNYHFSSVYSLKKLLNLFFLTIIGTSGIVLFVLYQWIRFKSPLLFIEAQRNWGRRPFSARIDNIFHLYPIFFPGSFRSLLDSLSFKSNGISQIIIEYCINTISFIITLILTVIVVKRAKSNLSLRYLVVYNLLVVLVFIWTEGSIQGPMSVTRLFYIAIPTFLGSGILAEKSNAAFFSIISIFAVVLFLQSAFFISGYWVV